LLLIHRGRRYGFEFKYSDAPTMTKSLHVALGDLNLERAWIVYPGKESRSLAKLRIGRNPLEFESSRRQITNR
jgi:hypothetical protein